MNILLILPLRNPSSRTTKTLIMPQLTLHLLEGLTPLKHQVKTVEEEIQDINLDEECNLVGISCMTSNAPRAYYFAQEFRKRGKTVVLGGVHPTILPGEALPYADSIVIGEAEGVWEQLLTDFHNGHLKKIYHAPRPPLNRYIAMKHRKKSIKGLFKVIPVMTTRGCPYNCEFCCVSHLFGKKIRHIPIENVIRDLQESEGKKFMFLDDNIIGNPVYAKKLFKAIKPLKISWSGQASISLVHNRELLQLAVESGCGALFMGLESVSENQLKKMRKLPDKIRQVEEAVKEIKDLGIHLHASMVFGFDTDKKSVFPETLEFLMRNHISTASFNILTPYPGTRIYQQFKQEGRLLTTDWECYDHATVVFKPKHMTPFELQEGKNWVKKEFSKISFTLKRVPHNLSHPLLHLAVNFATRKNVKSDYRKLSQQDLEIFQPKIYGIK